MPGELHQFSSQLWMFEGGFVGDQPGLPDSGNVLLYQAADRLYLFNSGLGPAVRTAIEEQLMAMGMPYAFTLLNTSGEIGCNGNNDIFHNVLADRKEHLTPVQLDTGAAQVLAGRLYALSRYVDPFRAVEGKGLRQLGLRLMREGLAAFTGQRTALDWMVSLFARRWPLVDPSADTASLLPADAEPLKIGSTVWQGWRLGTDDVWVLQTGNGLWCYLPAEQTLFAPGWREAFSPAWPEMQNTGRSELLEKLMTMTREGVVAVLADDSHGEAVREREAVLQIAEQLHSRRQGLQQALEAILHRDPGMTVRQLHSRLRKLRHRPAVAWYLDEPLPAGMFCFEQFLAGLLLEMGCATKGVWRHKKFYIKG